MISEKQNPARAHRSVSDGVFSFGILNSPYKHTTNTTQHFSCAVLLCGFTEVFDKPPERYFLGVL